MLHFDRRLFLFATTALAACGVRTDAQGAQGAETGQDAASTGVDADLFDDPRITPLGEADIDYAAQSEDWWRERLSREEFRVLREEGTERPGTSPLNQENRRGIFVCAGCALPLFSSRTKFESGTGWPSFWAPLEGAMETKTDYRLWTPRTEYHCTRCQGHQGHVFEDGPRPTGERWCNNGVALAFVPHPSEA
ncbi:MAG: peptide-methionine (R)-S-oxide reductase MsrB [Oceanicaulis sp.]